MDASPGAMDRLSGALTKMRARRQVVIDYSLEIILLQV
jgi:hypothetical protein